MLYYFSVWYDSVESNNFVHTYTIYTVRCFFFTVTVVGNISKHVRNCTNFQRPGVAENCIVAPSQNDPCIPSQKTVTIFSKIVLLHLFPRSIFATLIIRYAKSFDATCLKLQPLFGTLIRPAICCLMHLSGASEDSWPFHHLPHFHDLRFVDCDCYCSQGLTSGIFCTSETIIYNLACADWQYSWVYLASIVRWSKR